MNSIADLHSVYLEEVLKPQIAPKFQVSQKPSESDLNGDGNVDSFEKKVRQFIYDVRHLMKKNNIPVEKAFQMRSSKTNYGAEVIKTAKEKLGIKSGGSVSEENINEFKETGNKERLYKIVIRYKNGTTYRKRTTQSEIAKIRSNPNVSSVEKTEYAPGLDYDKERKGKLDPVGQEDADINNDGKSNTETDKYLLNRRRVRGDAIAKRKTHGLGESYSDWRSDLCEVIDDEISSQKKKQVKGMPKNKTNKVKMFPNIEEEIQNLGGVLLENTLISEEKLIETVNVAANYFVNEGLNEYGVNILVEELGLDEFINFVFDIYEESDLSEARKGGVKIEPKLSSGKPVVGKPKANTLKALRKKKAARSEAEEKASAEKPSGMKAALQRQSAIASAAKQQPKKQGLLSRVAHSTLNAIERGIERHNRATRSASKLGSEVSKTASKAAKKVGGVAKEFGSGVGVVAKAGKRVVTGEEYNIQEVAPPGSKFERMVKHIKSGYRGKGGLTKKEKGIAYATAWKSYNKTHKEEFEIDEAIDSAIVDQPTPADDNVRKTQSDTVKKQQQQQRLQQLRNLNTIEKQTETLQRKKLNLQKQNKLPLSTSYEFEGESIEELNRYEKETGKDSRTGKPTSKGGKYGGSDVNSQIMRSVLHNMGAGRPGAAGRGQKKVPGQKPPKAGEYGGPRSPAQKVARRREAAQRAQDMMHSRFD